ncbi:calcium-binding protein [Nocardioides anomalus]|uniref:Calcium-binding protein n=1 Tax=Nocardioides anomalus TaxID=2712223 RepID=A0A6G6WI49_9ACTN|nr:calcium-binding protein [Nocardioides anomalus]QIG44914.1 calcium-binding protein [Nocardioides anomalus]
MRAPSLPATVLVPVLVLAGTLVGPPSPAHAATTCRDQAATIEASEGTVEGTPGPDVIVVTGTNTKVLAGEGDDTICVVGGAGVVGVDAGPGNDVVDTTAAGVPTDTVLGPGADTFTGGPQSDTVRSSGDAATDTVATGAGRDTFTTYANGPVVVDLGPDDDILSFNATAGTAGSQLDLGDGSDLLLVEDAVDLAIDLAEGTLVQKGVVSKAVHAEDVQASGRDVVVRGDDSDNDVRVTGCRVTLSGDGGNDVLAQIGQPAQPDPTCKVKATLRGQGGKDRLRGFSGRDTLIGGRGRDIANGGSGRDRCSAERVRRCER